MSDRPASLTPPPEGYAEWLAELKRRIHGAQQRATLPLPQAGSKTRMRAMRLRRFSSLILLSPAASGAGRAPTRPAR